MSVNAEPEISSTNNLPLVAAPDANNWLENIHNLPLRTSADNPAQPKSLISPATPSTEPTPPPSSGTVIVA